MWNAPRGGEGHEEVSRAATAEKARAGKPKAGSLRQPLQLSMIERSIGGHNDHDGPIGALSLKHLIREVGLFE